MNLPDFTQFEPLTLLKAKMGVTRGHYGAFPQTSHKPRAWILLKSGRRLDLLDPRPDAWTDKDLAIGISRTYRWGGYSKWDLPLSVAQHSLAVLALREAEGPLTALEDLREILHDATEPLAGGWDCIAPLKPHLGPAFEQLDRRLQAAVDQRYQLPAWTGDIYARHKHADRCRNSISASFGGQGSHGCMPHGRVRGSESRGSSVIPRLARMSVRLQPTTWKASLAAANRQDFSRLSEKMRRRYCCPPTGNSLTDTFVYVEAGDGSQSLEGVIVDGQRDEDGSFNLEAEFTVFTTDDNPGGELIRVNGARRHVEIL
jgi:hypothetical protein